MDEPKQKNEWAYVNKGASFTSTKPFQNFVPSSDANCILIDLPCIIIFMNKEPFAKLSITGPERELQDSEKSDAQMATATRKEFSLKMATRQPVYVADSFAKDSKTFFDQYTSWSEAELAWDQGHEKASVESPIKRLDRLPQMVGITPETKKNLLWKSLKWIWQEDHDYAIRKGFLRHPLRNGFRFLKSIFSKQSFQQSGDLFFYGIKSINDFKKALQRDDSLFVIGFSYCHKPFECPSGRFTDQCQRDFNHPVCRQCFIGKSLNALHPTNSVALIIPTIHYIGGRIFDLLKTHKGKSINFLITACEMTLTMFGDLGNMAGIKGIGIRLDGRICNTMRAFELSEKGIKPGLTVVLPETQRTILKLLQHHRQHSS